MKFEIYSEAECRRRLKAGAQPDVVFSISDSKEANLKEKYEILIYRFQFADRVFEEDKEAPNISDVKRIVEIAKTLNTEQEIWFHCHAGISRSSATALVVFSEMFGPEYACEIVSTYKVFLSRGKDGEELFEDGSSWFVPNNLITKIYDKMTQKNLTELLEKYFDFYKPRFA